MGTEPKKTHRAVKNPSLNHRFLADYMAASDRRKRTLIRDCKYKSLARQFQHQEAKAGIRQYLNAGEMDEVESIEALAEELRARTAFEQFERDLFDYNADYLDRFAKTFDPNGLPAEMAAGPKYPAIDLNGVRVTFDVPVTFRRTMKGSNRVRFGGMTLRYEKGKALPEDVGLWQSALLFGYLSNHVDFNGAEPEQKLCTTLDVWTGKHTAAPGDSITRFRNAEAACATIAEQWPNIPPPENAQL